MFLIIHVYFCHCLSFYFSYREKILRFEIYKNGNDDDDNENDYDNYGNNSEMRIIRQCFIYHCRSYKDFQSVKQQA